MNFILMHETVANHDAIGVDIDNMYRILSRNHVCRVYALNKMNKNLRYITETTLERYLADKDTTVIYHHSVYWEHGFEKLQQAKCKIIIRYHNITPESFFEPYNKLHYNQCKKGIAQTVLLQKTFPNAFWLSDSVRNRQDLTLVKDEKVKICPPFNNTEEWAKTVPDEAILKQLIESDTLNVLFVGRIAPNKGHKYLLDVIRTYSILYDKKIKLRIIGKFDLLLNLYNGEIRDTIKDYHLNNMIEFVGEINDSTLMAYYLGSDAFLCCSDHEGYCVPIIEAQYFGLPIVAKQEPAVHETMGDNQLEFDNSKSLAVALRKIKDDERASDYLIQKGRNNFESRFSHTVIEELFAQEIKQIIGVDI